MYTPKQSEEIAAIAAEMETAKLRSGRGNIRLRKLLGDEERAQRVAEIHRRMRSEDGGNASRS